MKVEDYIPGRSGCREERRSGWFPPSPAAVSASLEASSAIFALSKQKENGFSKLLPVQDNSLGRASIVPKKVSTKGRRIDLGLALLSVLNVGEPLLLEDIAAWCGCSPSAVSLIEQRALRKIRVRLKFRDRALCAELAVSEQEGFSTGARCSQAALDGS